jgi:hypothetical protein
VLKSQLQGAFKVEVTQHWGHPQQFIDAFTQNHTSLMDFMIKLFNRPVAHASEQDSEYLNSLEEQILKSLNIKHSQ